MFSLIDAPKSQLAEPIKESPKSDERIVKLVELHFQGPRVSISVVEGMWLSRESMKWDLGSKDNDDDDDDEEEDLARSDSNLSSSRHSICLANWPDLKLSHTPAQQKSKGYIISFTIALRCKLCS